MILPVSSFNTLSPSTLTMSGMPMNMNMTTTNVALPQTQASFLTVSDSLVVVDDPLPEDILCGKDKRCMTHEGSLYFKGIIDAHTVAYREAATRQGKMAVTKSVFDLLQTRRFLKLNEDTKQWEVLHPLCIRDKIGHALRFANRKQKSSSTTSTKTTKKGKQSKLAKKTKGKTSSSAAATKKTQLKAYTSSSSVSSASSSSSSDSSMSCSDSSRSSSTRGSVSLNNLDDSLTQLDLPTAAPSKVTSADATTAASSPQQLSDLDWIMQLPIMEVSPLDNQVYFVPQDGTTSTNSNGASPDTATSTSTSMDMPSIEFPSIDDPSLLPTPLAVAAL